jgi:hypothetical protein
VVAGGEHGADGAEDYDAEDRDDDAVGARLSVCVLSLFHLFLGFGVPCPRIESRDDGLHDCWLVLPYRVLGRGLRGSRWVENLVLAVRGSGMNAVEVLLRSSSCEGGVERVW